MAGIDTNSAAKIKGVSVSNVAPLDDQCLTYDAGTGLATWETNAAAGNTLDTAYDQGGAGAGRTIDVDSGAVELTVSDTDNNAALILNQNDTTNNPNVLEITNTGSGNDIELGTGRINNTGTDINIQTTTNGAINLNPAPGSVATTNVSYTGTSGTRDAFQSIFTVSPTGASSAQTTSMLYSVELDTNQNLTDATGGLRGSRYLIDNGGTGTVTKVVGADMDIENANTGVITEASAFKVVGKETGGGTFTTFNAFELTNNTGTIGTNYLLKLDASSDWKSGEALVVDDNGTPKYIPLTSAAGGETLSEVLSNGNTTGGTDISFTAGDKITMVDNTTSAFEIVEGANTYIRFNTNNAAEQIFLDKQVVFGNDLDASSQATIFSVIDNSAIALDIKQGGNSYITLNTTNGSEVLTLSGLGDVHLLPATDLVLSDGNKSGSGYASEFILSDSSAEWNTFETNFGEVSLLNALNQAAAGGVAPSETDYVFAYDTTIQTVAVANTLQDITFNTNAELDGWTHTVSTANFTCAVTGTYRVEYTFNAEKTGGATSQLEVVALNNGAQVAGSAVGVECDANNKVVSASNSFIVDCTATQILKLQMTGQTITTRINTGINTITVKPTITLSITRIK